ncbi:hypothetical protein BCR41DRAFT_364899 [Lobosporangium transversale]|uniref:Uncharacterized protein n=1 Tax=Lobosporangium transversale TaxID=64571 RepID=A0A1Y2G5V9_9FUNG|nr:hypothetical protein BCR41DRAFT_364899 [Lobosporangium transversale]ORY96071.1 hypothetical protein BCR41DRAFT_364899 [Lobosporangium transversale]|eukprot:XP_021875498.1 hypothetical protein BCR41DRAFT_364899 [Lobosporangium transversale]
MAAMNPPPSRTSKAIDSQDNTLSANEGSSLSAHPSVLGAPIKPTTSANTVTNGSNSADNDSDSNAAIASSGNGQESYSPWDMPPIIQPVSSASDTRSIGGLKGFSSLNSTWTHFRSKPHPTISVPVTPTSLHRPSIDMAAPTTPPRSSAYSNPDDSDNAMCTPTFGSGSSNYSRRNSAVSAMALDTPPPLSLMDLETPSMLGPNFGSAQGSGAQGPLSRSLESSFNSGNNGYPFPPFGMRSDSSSSLSRRSSRANSMSMEPRHVRKASEDTTMSDGGNNSGSERSRRHSPAVVPFERSVRRSALLPKPKGLLKVFSQLEACHLVVVNG